VGLNCAGASEPLTLDDGHDGALLDSRRALETVGVDTTEELSLQVHVVEGVGGLIVVGLDLACMACQSALAKSGCCAALRRERRPQARGFAAVQRKYFAGGHSPSGTSSRPLSAMIAVSCVEDYWHCL